VSPRISVDTARIAEFCGKWRITELALFGSVLRDDFRTDSDVDVLATFAPDAHTTLFDMVHMQDELEEMLGRKVDLVSRRGIEHSPNYIRRKDILASAEVIYAT
jgi:predicted nucleotidyltransferase